MKRELILKNRLKEIRSDKNITQEELARMCGVARNTITSIERYEYYPTAYLACIICKVLEKNFEELFYLDVKD